MFGSRNALRRGWLTVASSEAEPGCTTGTTYSKESKLHEVEKEEGIVWEPKEWNQAEWKAYWKREGEGIVSALLPFDEGQFSFFLYKVLRLSGASELTTSSPSPRTRRSPAQVTTSTKRPTFFRRIRERQRSWIRHHP